VADAPTRATCRPALTSAAARWPSITFPSATTRDRKVHRMSLDRRAGDHGGHCRPSGAGKTTLVRLALRMIDPRPAG
jgi:ABC-type multidrug transport system fused ATPase/permease subunit